MTLELTLSEEETRDMMALHRNVEYAPFLLRKYSIDEATLNSMYDTYIAQSRAITKRFERKN
jgi:hypothetical protein